MMKKKLIKICCSLMVALIIANLCLAEATTERDEFRLVTNNLYIEPPPPSFKKNLLQFVGVSEEEYAKLTEVYNINCQAEDADSLLSGVTIGRYIFYKNAAFDMQGHRAFEIEIWRWTEETPPIPLVERLEEGCFRSMNPESLKFSDADWLVKEDNIFYVERLKNRWSQYKGDEVKSERELVRYYEYRYELQVKSYGERYVNHVSHPVPPDRALPYIAEAPTVDEMKQICHEILTIVHNKERRPKDIEKAKKSYEEDDAIREKHHVRWDRNTRGNTPCFAENAWMRYKNKEWDESADLFWADQVNGVAEELGLNPLEEKNIIPNVNTGVGCRDFVQSLLTRGMTMIEQRGGKYCLWARMKDKNVLLRYCIYHAFNPTDARYALLGFQLYENETGVRRRIVVDAKVKKMEKSDIKNLMQINPRLVGDWDICTVPRLASDGSIAEGSEKSAIYFMRGNTAAYFIADDPHYNVLPLAQELDKLLIEGINRHEKEEKQAAKDEKGKK